MVAKLKPGGSQPACLACAASAMAAGWRHTLDLVKATVPDKEGIWRMTQRSRSRSPPGQTLSGWRATTGSLIQSIVEPIAIDRRNFDGYTLKQRQLPSHQVNAGAQTKRRAGWLFLCLPICLLWLTNTGSLDLSSVEPITVQPGSFRDYERKQRQLSSHIAPTPAVDFTRLFQPQSRHALADNSAYILETFDSAVTCGKTILIRPRRFGKTTFGRLWLEFFRGNKGLFQNLAVSDELVPEPGCYVCVHLDISNARPSNFVEVALVRALNKALAAAGLPELDPKLPTAHHALGHFTDLVHKAGRKAAVFVDEYDSMVLESSGAECQQALTETATLFRLLKAYSEHIPFVFITGSSRITISGLWSGGNDIEDISYTESMASALGYSWEQISSLYATQICMLQQLHGLSRDDLKQKIEFMYNGYRFSPDSEEVVFNLWAINRLMQTGKFQPHFALSGLSVLATGSLPPTTILALRIPGNAQQVTEDEIAAWRYSPELASEPLAVWVQLLSAGLLTFAGEGGALFLKVPNEDARFALSRVLPPFAHGISADTFSTLLGKGDVRGIVELLQPRLQEVARGAAANAAGADGVLEYHLQQAFFAIVYALWERDRADAWTVASEVRVQQSGNSPRVDFLIRVRRGQMDTYYAFEFGRCKGAPTSAVIEKLRQAEKYFDVARNQAATLVTAVIWSNNGELLSVDGPHSRAAAAERVRSLTASTSATSK